MLARRLLFAFLLTNPGLVLILHYGLVYVLALSIYSSFCKAEINMSKTLIGIDLFSGAGGLSLGAEMAGVEVKVAVERDQFAAQTYRSNHKDTLVINSDIKTVEHLEIERGHSEVVLFGGPPCQGFSTSNQKTRSKTNPQNWLFKEFVRIADEIMPDWIVFENVKGIFETEKGYFVDEISNCFSNLGYTCTPMVLSACNYGIPQKRSRFFLICSANGKIPSIPKEDHTMVTVKDALEDLPSLLNGASENVLPYKKNAKSDYARNLRQDLKSCSGHLVTKNSDAVIERYSYIPQGGNWRNIPDEFMTSYSDKSRCHTGIYRRLSSDEPSITVGNYRKSMLIHPWENRGLSVREAARLQSFPDTYVFCGSIGFQQQQVGNAVPPLLAKRVFETIVSSTE